MSVSMTYTDPSAAQHPISIYNCICRYKQFTSNRNIFHDHLIEKELSQDPLYCSCSYNQSTPNRNTFQENLKRRRGMQGYIHISSWVSLTALSFLEFPYTVITVLDLYPWPLLVGRPLPMRNLSMRIIEKEGDAGLHPHLLLGATHSPVLPGVPILYCYNGARPVPLVSAGRPPIAFSRPGLPSGTPLG